jgi:nitrous oxidase accessory protein NosD
MNKIRRLLPLLATLAVTPAIALVPAPVQASGSASTWVVDRDGVECGNADFTSIQAAVDAAQPGDVVRVCPDVYAETVTVDKPLTLTGDADAVEAVDCFDPAAGLLGDADPTRHAIVDPAGDGFTLGFALKADGIVVAGFVVQGASVGVDASDRFSGYRVHHNLIRLNTLFGMDFGSAGTHESRVDHNCLRENRWGLVSELDDDSLWKFSDGPERDEWNARDLINTRIHHNLTFRNLAGLEAAGPGRREQVIFNHNLSRSDGLGIAIQNSIRSAIVDNDITSSTSGSGSIRLGGANSDLTIATNVVTGGQIGILFRAPGFIDVFSTPSRAVVVTGNTVRGVVFGGINANPGTAEHPGDLRDSIIADNVSSDNGRDGIVLFGANTGNQVRNNVTERNGRNGIYAARVVLAGQPFAPSENTFEGNRMVGNAEFDARDDARELNTWTGNQCVTDSPAGTICGIG